MPKIYNLANQIKLILKYSTILNLPAHSTFTATWTSPPLLHHVMLSTKYLPNIQSSKKYGKWKVGPRFIHFKLLAHPS